MADEVHGVHQVTLRAVEGGERADQARGEIARALGGDVVAIGEGETLDLEVTAPSREEAERLVADAIAAAGADLLFTLSERTEP